MKKIGRVLFLLLAVNGCALRGPKLFEPKIHANYQIGVYYFSSELGKAEEMRARRAVQRAEAIINQNVFGNLAAFRFDIVFLKAWRPEIIVRESETGKLSETVLLKQMSDVEHSQSADNYVLFVHEPFIDPPRGGITLGVAEEQQEKKSTGLVVIVQDTDNTDVDSYTLIHELGHTMGLKHTSNSECAATSFIMCSNIGSAFHPTHKETLLYLYAKKIKLQQNLSR